MIEATTGKLSKMLEYTAAFAVAVVPLIVWPTFRPVVIPKAVLAEAFALLVGGVALLFYRPLRLSLPQLLLLAFLSWGLIVVCQSSVPFIAMEGGFQRLWGWRVWATLALWFFGLGYWFHWFRPRRIFLGLEVAAILLSVYTLLQRLELDPLSWTSLYGTRAHATLENPNTLALFLALVAPFFLLRLRSESRREFAVGSGGIVLLFLALWASGSRSGWLAMLAGLGATGLFIAFPRKPAIAGLWCISLLVAAWTSPWWAYGSRPTGEARRVIWQAAVRGIAERPIWGRGFDLLTPFFDRVLPAYLVYLQGDVRVDRAHNEILDLTMSVGIPGVLLYVGLLAVVYWSAWRVLSRQDHPARLLTAAVAGSCLAFHVGMALNFITLSLGWVAFALWAYLATLREKPAVARTSSVSSLVRWGSVIVILAIWAGLNLPRCQADSLAYEAAHDTCPKVASLRQAVLYRPRRGEYHAFLGHALWQTENLDAAEESFRRAIEVNPVNFAPRTELGKFYLLTGRTGDADEVYHHTLTMAPENARLWKEWGDIAAAQGKQESALGRYRRALDLNETLAEAYLAMGDIYLERDNQEAAYWCFDAVRRLRPSLLQDRPDAQQVVKDYQP